MFHWAMLDFHKILTNTLDGNFESSGGVLGSSGLGCLVEWRKLIQKIHGCLIKSASGFFKFVIGQR
jgi:hypothetical protein